MNIDCTVFVQMINFFLAYVIMRWLLFKPVVALIDAENNEKKRIEDVAKLLEASIKLTRQEQNQLWDAFHKSVASEISSINDEDKSISDRSATAVEIEALSPEQESDLIDSCAERVIKKVEYVRK